MTRAYIALGSNLGVPEDHLSGALDAIGGLPDTTLDKTSRWYRTAPIGGPPDQPDFLNAVCRIDTRLAPYDLLHALQCIEQDFGRVRLERWGPRTLDLDIILYGDRVQNDPELTLPHPRAHERAFVLVPLADLDPSVLIQGKTASDWLPTVADQEIAVL